MLAGIYVWVAGMIVGLVISVFQAATQINEMTMTFVPCFSTARRISDVINESHTNSAVVLDAACVKIMIPPNISRVDVVAFLDRLSYGPESTPGLDENWAEWNANLDVNREWYTSAREGGDPSSGE